MITYLHISSLSDQIQFINYIDDYIYSNNLKDIVHDKKIDELPGTYRYLKFHITNKTKIIRISIVTQNGTVRSAIILTKIKTVQSVLRMYINELTKIKLSSII